MSTATTPQSAVDRLRGYLAQDPDNWNLRADLFDAALAAGDRETARAEVERALASRPDDAPWRNRQALLHLSEREYARAQAVLEALVAEGHDDPVIRQNLAWALFSQGQLEGAGAMLEPLLARPDEGGAAAWVLWLRCQHRLYRADTALERFVAESSRRPLPPDAFGVAALMAIDENRPDDARVWSEGALRGRKDQVEALVARGTIALLDQDPTAAMAWFDAALRLNPADGRTWSGLAMARMLKMDLPGALDAFQKAVTDMPGHVGTWITFGWCRFLANDVNGAREAFEEALRLDRNVAENHGALAVVLARLGDTAAARAEIDVALKLDRKSLSARYAEAMLSGDTKDPEAFMRFARRVLGALPAGDREKDRTLADVVFGKQG